MAIDGVRNQRIQQAQKAVREAEKDAAKKIKQARNRVLEAQRQAEQRENAIRDAYSERIIRQQDKNEQHYLNTRQKGLESVDDIKRRIRKQIRTIEDQGDQQLNQVKNYYQNEIQEKTLEGKKKLRSELNLLQQTKEYEKDKATQQLKSLQQNNLQQTRRTLDQHQDRLHRIRESSQKEYQTLKKNYLQAREESKNVFNQNLNQINQAHQMTIDRINRNASKQINSMSEHYSRALNTYDNRQSDPFYQLVRIDGALEEANDGYLFFARIPKHEQDEITVTVNGQDLVVGGTRRSKERLSTEDGKKVTTTSFQSYHETFPLSLPVDEKNLSREFDGDYLIVTVPKLKHKPAPIHRSPPQDRPELRVPRPQFPPGVEPKATESNANDSPETPPASTKSARLLS